MTTFSDRVIRARVIAREGDIATAKDRLYGLETECRCAADEQDLRAAWQRIEELGCVQ